MDDQINRSKVATMVVKAIPEAEPKVPKSSEKLQQELKILEQDWQSFTQSSRPKTHNSLSKCNSVHHQLILLDTSPRELMSSLQHQRRLSLSSTGSGEDEEVIRRERKLAIESGEMKGRRLFEDDYEKGFEGGDEEIEKSMYDEERKAGEVKQGMLCSCLAEEELNEERERVVVEVKEVKEEKEVGERKGGVVGGGKEYGGRLGIGKLCFAIVLALVAFVLGVLGGFDGLGSRVDVTLVPT